MFNGPRLNYKIQTNVRDNFSYIADAAHMEIADHLKVLDRFQVSGIFFINLLGEFLNFPCYELGTINDIVTIKWPVSGSDSCQVRYIHS